MDIVNFTPQKQKSRGISALFATGLDVTLVVAGALTASHFCIDRLAEGHVHDDFVALSIALALALFPSFKIYQSWRGRSMVRLIGQMSFAWLAVQTFCLLLMFALQRNTFFSWLWLAYWTGATGGMLIVSRVVVHSVLRRIRHAGLDLRKVAVIGRGVYCREVVRKIETAPASGFRASAAFDLRPVAHQTWTDIPVFEDFVKFSQFVRAEGVQELWLALPLFEESAIRLIVNEFSDNLLDIRFIPDVSGLALFESGMIDLIGLPAINLMASPLSSHELVKKELFDRAFATLALIALAPVLLAIAVAVKASSRGPIFFRQKRNGAAGRAFNIYKFRTMYLHTDSPGVVQQATRGDSRITRVGAFLRRTSLDELPQFINVLRGEMSVVGPRPHAIEHDELYQKIVSGYIHRYRAKPGITGWAQVNGYRGETDRIEKMEGRVEYDLYYIKNWSFSLDMRIVVATIVNGFSHSNAY